MYIRMLVLVLVGLFCQVANAASVDINWVKEKWVVLKVTVTVPEVDPDGNPWDNRLLLKSSILPDLAIAFESSNGFLSETKSSFLNSLCTDSLRCTVNLKVNSKDVIVYVADTDLAFGKNKLVPMAKFNCDLSKGICGSGKYKVEVEKVVAKSSDY